MILLILAAVIGAGAFVLLMKLLWSKAQPVKLGGTVALAATILVGALLLLTASGRLHWIPAIATAVLPFLKSMARFAIGPLGNLAFKSWMSRRGPTQATGSAAPNTSSTATPHLEMALNHASGEMVGKILFGHHAGRELASLNVDELVMVAADWRQRGSPFAESVQLLTAYLDRRAPDWQASAAAPPPPSDGPMTREKALEVLGLDESADQDEVVAAHRRLMHRLHPDRGGSDFLAATLNEAKRTLLGE